MKNKYLIKIKDLTQNEQTEFIASNLKDNLIRLKVVMIMLVIVELLILALALIPSINLVPDKNHTTYVNMYFIVIVYSMLFIGILYYMNKHHSEKTILPFRIIILTGLMLLLFWGASMKLLNHGNFLQPSIYILILLSVSVIPFFNYWEILIVTLPSQLFITIITITENSIKTQSIAQIIMDSWGFILLAIIFSTIQYLDRVQYFKKDALLKKQNNLLKQHSEIDALTDIYNRRKLDATMEFEWKRSSRTKQSIAFLLIDLDHFKKYNDTYGHIEGDMCLRKSAAIMKESLKRSSDMIFRYGGEEFIILAPETDLSGASIHAERLRNDIEKHAFNNVGHITSSFGVTEFNAEKDDVESLFERVDIALYTAKENGRNRVEKA